MTYEEQERAAIVAEPGFPAPGTPERERIESAHRATCAGLIRAAGVEAAR